MTALALVQLPAGEPSIVPATEQERVRLLLAMKTAADFYDLHFAIAEHTGYVRGLWLACDISSSQLVLFQAQARRVAGQSADRLAKVTS